MARLMLVNPPVSGVERYGMLAAAGSYAPPLALVSLAAVARENGHEVAVVDAPVQELNHDQTLDRVRRFSPDIVGLTSVTATFLSAGRLAVMVKGALPETFVIVGGPHVSAIPEESLALFREIDALALSEGEQTLLDLLADEKYRDRDAWPSVMGLAYREDAEVRVNPDRPFIADLDSLPLPAWDLLENFPRSYNLQVQSIARFPSTSVCTSRGCPAKCTFCDRRVFGAQFRGNSAPYVMRVVEDLHYNYAIKNIQFEDDFFTADRRRLVQICESLIRAKMDLTWSCQAKVKSITPDTAKLMKKAGCWSVLFGIESGNQEILNLMQKHIALKDIERAVEICRNAGIHTKGFFITGNVGETRESLDDTRMFVKRVKLEDISLHYLCPFPGSKIYQVADQWGTFNPDWSQMNFFIKPVFVPNGLTEADLIYYTKRTYRDFYLRPRTVYSYLRRIRSLPHLHYYARSAMGLVRFIYGKRGELATSSTA